MADPAFTLPPDGMLSEQIALPDHRLALGLLHIDGAGVRVCAWDGERMRHMAPAAARRWASDLENCGHELELRPVIDGLRKLVERTEEIAAMIAGNQAAVAAGLVEMPVEGRA